MSDIVVLGATGFIGTQLVRRLAGVRLHVKVLTRQKIDTNLPSIFTDKNIEVFVGDLQDQSVLGQILKPGDIVFDLVSTSTPSSSSKSPLNEIEEHVNPQIKMIQMACEIGVGKIIYISSGGGIYGKNTEDPISESEVIQPSSPHAIAKATIEYYMHYFGKKYRIPQLIYRLSNPYGPGQVQKPGFGLIPTLFSNVKENVAPVLYDNGSAIRDFIYIDDLIDGIALSYDKQNRHNIYNIGSGIGTPTLEIWNMIKNMTKSDLEPNMKPRREFDVSKYVLNIDRFAAEYGWKPNTSLVDGLSKTWEWTQR